MNLHDELRRRGGVARTRTLLAAGVSTHALRVAKREATVRSIRKGWVAAPDADARLVGAAQRGVVLSCVTSAERLGLWVPRRGQLHVAAHPHAARVAVPEGVVVHWSNPVAPRHPDALEDGLVNTLSLVAQCQPFETALVIWESALNSGAVDLPLLRGLELPPAARRVRDEARPFSDSGLETICISRLRWLKLPIVPQAWVLGHRVDLLIGERLIVQIDGASHTGVQRTSDIDHDARLLLRGYHVLRFSYEQIMERWPEVQAVIMDAVARGLHRA
jgi:very-short-patch-repair endonuclease